MIDFYPAMFESPAAAPSADAAGLSANAGNVAAPPARAARSSYAPPPPSATRWRFAFDRWTTVAAADEEFVLA